jgi:hypothetical protein
MSENGEEKEEFVLHQFQRNRYFYGKLMTVRDFELEQEYFNGKRYLLNRLIHGKGILCGFYNLELFPEESGEVKIRFRDGGIALDSLGREIVVPIDMEKKIMTREGVPFKKQELIKSAYLYLKYRSVVSELVRAASNPLSCEEIACPNRILEDFEVIATFEPPTENENKNLSVSCTACAEADEKVFFAAVNDDLSINDEESSHRHFLQTRSEESSIKTSATGVVYFKQPTVNSITSPLIDPKLGTGPIFIQLGLETEENQILTGFAGDGVKNGYSGFQLQTILDPSSGKFNVQVIFKDESERKPIRVRWWALRADTRYRTEEVKSDVTLTKYRFVSDPDVKVKIVENGLCESGAKNCMEFGVICGGDHYPRIGNDVALNGNPKKLAEIVREQQNKDETKQLYTKWEVGGGWVLEVENFDSTLKPPVVEIKLKFEEKELKSFEVSKGDLITYCEDIAGENGVPLFVTYIDDIYIPGIKSLIGKEAKVILKYTWAVSKNVRILD